MALEENHQSEAKRIIDFPKVNYTYEQWQNFWHTNASRPFEELTEMEVKELVYCRAFMKEVEAGTIPIVSKPVATPEMLAEYEKQKANPADYRPLPKATESFGEDEFDFTGDEVVEKSAVVLPEFNPDEAAALPPVETMKKELHEKNLVLAGAQPATPDVLAGHNAEVEEIRREAKQEKSPMRIKWELAEAVARNPKAELVEERKNDAHLQAMVNYCKDRIRETGEVGPYPLEVIDIFWTRPKVLDMSDQAAVRRDEVVGRVRDFYAKAVAGDLSSLMNTKSESYRTILTAMALNTEIENYATNFRTPDTDPNKIPDAERINRIKAAAKAYIESHAAPTRPEVPGPINTLDPDYPTYWQLCKKYDIPLGTYLHTLSI